MICEASSKQRSIRSARICNSRSPGVATAWRAPALISWKGCNSAGRGWPKSLSQASDPTPRTHERFPSMSRKPTARSKAARSAHRDRTAAQLAGLGLIVATRKMAARVRGRSTACGAGGGPFPGLGMVNDTASSSKLLETSVIPPNAPLGMTIKRRWLRPHGLARLSDCRKPPG